MTKENFNETNTALIEPEELVVVKNKTEDVDNVILEKKVTAEVAKHRKELLSYIDVTNNSILSNFKRIENEDKRSDAGLLSSIYIDMKKIEDACEKETSLESKEGAHVLSEFNKRLKRLANSYKEILNVFPHGLGTVKDLKKQLDFLYTDTGAITKLKKFDPSIY